MLIALYALAAWCIASLFTAAVASRLLKGAAIWSPKSHHNRLGPVECETSPPSSRLRWDAA
jgi:hypothetical protein